MMKRSKIHMHPAGLTTALASVFLLMPAFACAQFPDPPAEKSAPRGAAAAGKTETAVLAGGCFWGMEGVFERLKGVKDVVSGYAGGRGANPSYEQVTTGTTGHAESIRIVFDPAQVSYGTLLKVFFSVAHDPTQLNRQGPDRGTQYRSAVFYASPGQKLVAEEYIRTIDRARVFPVRVVTQVAPLTDFYPAEEYHQDFMDKNPDYPYIVFWDKPKVAHLERLYPDLVSRK